MTPEITRAALEAIRLGAQRHDCGEAPATPVTLTAEEASALWSHLGVLAARGLPEHPRPRYLSDAAEAEAFRATVTPPEGASYTMEPPLWAKPASAAWVPPWRKR